MVIINVFVSSKTVEFARERKVIKEELEGLSKSIKVFIFENDARPSSKKPDEVYRDKVSRCHIYIGLFRNEYSKPTLDEYNIALSNNKERLIYINDTDVQHRDPRLANEISRFHRSTCKHVTDRDNLSGLIRDHIIDVVAESFDLSLPSININGLVYLYPNYFDNYNKDNLEDWKNGFEFNLFPIKTGQEIKREHVLREILSKLKSQLLLILVGELGSSKTTILNEIVCYFNSSDYYTFLVENIEPKDVSVITTSLERFLNRKKKIFVACDNILSQKAISLLEIIKKINQHRFRGNIKFLVTAISPDLYNLINYQMSLPIYAVNAFEHISSLLYLTRKRDNIYEIPPFTIEETKNFILRYDEKLDAKSKSRIDSIAEERDKEAKGNVFLIKCFTLQHSLQDHIIKILRDYLSTQDKLETMLICALVSLSNITISEALMKRLGIMSNAVRLKGITLSRINDTIWQTIHKKWDNEFFNLLFSGEPNYNSYVNSFEQ